MLPKKNKPPKQSENSVNDDAADSIRFTKLFALFATGFLVLNAVVAYFAYDIFILQKQRATLEQLTLQQAQIQASAINREIQQLMNNISLQVQNDTFVSALENNQPSSLGNQLDRIRSSIDHLLGLSVFSKGTAEVDPNASLPIRFAEIDMINRAERAETVIPEAVDLAGTWRINIVVPIKNQQSDNIVGSVLASVDAQEFFKPLNTIDLSIGNTVVVQQFAQGTEQIVYQTGLATDDIFQNATVNSLWLTRFYPGTTLIQQSNVNPIFVLIGLVGLLALSTFVAYLLAKNTSKRLRSKAEQQHAVKQLAEEARKDRGGMDPLYSKQKMIKVEVRDEDSALLGSSKENSNEEDPLDITDAPVKTQSASATSISPEIFRSYDIRGLVETQLPPAHVVLIGRAIGSAVMDAGESTIVVGRDGRTHSPDITEQLIEGILAAGCNVVNIGMVPTPLVYFAIKELDNTNSGVMVTASHNPGDYNGFKIVINNTPYADEKIQALYQRIQQKQFTSGNGKEDFSDLSLQYIDRIFSDVALAGELSVVVDAGNGVAGDIAPRLFAELGCDVTPLFCEVDGTFPNHPADPSVMENLQPLIAKVKEVGADMGIALDGDGDRVGIVTSSGEIIMPDRLLMLLAKDIVSRNPGADVLYDVKSSRDLNTVISSYGGRPIMWKTGHSHMKIKMEESGALLGGELSGHIFIKERWYGFDDGLYVAARIMEIMSLREQSLDEIFESFPKLPSTPELKISIAEQQKFGFMDLLIAEGDFSDGQITIIDGLRVDYPDGWGLVRASNTSPSLTLRFEAESEDALKAIQQRFKNEIQKLKSDLEVPF